MNGTLYGTYSSLLSFSSTYLYLRLNSYPSRQRILAAPCEVLQHRRSGPASSTAVPRSRRKLTETIRHEVRAMM